MQRLFTSHIYLGCDRVKFLCSSLCGAVVQVCDVILNSENRSTVWLFLRDWFGISVLVVAGEWLPLKPFSSYSPSLIKWSLYQLMVFFTLSLFLLIPPSHLRVEQERSCLDRVSPLHITNLCYGCVDHNVYFLIFGNLVVLFIQYMTQVTQNNLL